MHCERHSECSIIRTKGLNKFAEDVLHETLTTCPKSSDLYEELTRLIYEVMDVAARKKQSTKFAPGFTNNNGNIVTKDDPPKLTKRSRRSSCRLSGISIPENVVLDNRQIKNCSVAIQQITDEDLKKYLAAEAYKKLIENGKHSDLKPLAKVSKMTINSEIDSNAEVMLNLNMDSEVMATEDHLDKLMAKEMKLCELQMEQRLRNSSAVMKLDTNSSSKMNNPVVILERLSSQFLSRAVKGTGKPGEDKEYEEITEIRRNNVLQKQKRTAATVERKKSYTARISSYSCSCYETTVSPGLRRSKRLSSCSYRHSAISLPCNSRHSNFCNKNKSYTSRKQYLDSDVLGNEENIPRQKRKTAPRKFFYSDDEDDFYGFEFPEKNRRKTYRLKKALRKLCAYTKGQENENNKIVKEGSQNHSRQTTPLKAINRIEQMFIAPDERISLLSDKRKYKERPFSNFSSRARGKSIGNESFIKQKFGDNYINDKAVDKLEILRLFKEREKSKLLMDKVIQCQRQNVRTRKPVNDKNGYEPVLDYYNSDNYIVQAGRQIPLWSEENVRSAIMSHQEKIPPELIASYFHNPEPVTLSALFGSPSRPKGNAMH